MQRLLMFRSIVALPRSRVFYDSCSELALFSLVSVWMSVTNNSRTVRDIISITKFSGHHPVVERANQFKMAVVGYAVGEKTFLMF